MSVATRYTWVCPCLTYIYFLLLPQKQAVQENKEEEEEERIPVATRKLGVPREVLRGESRVAITPYQVKEFRKLAYDVIVESGAGEAAGFTNEQYVQHGARIADAKTVFGSVDVIAKIRAPQPRDDVHEVDLMRPGAFPCIFCFAHVFTSFADVCISVRCLCVPGCLLISYINPSVNKQLMSMLAKANVNVWAMDCVPRTTKAQRLDCASSFFHALAA